jgi:hypothetical protein
MPSYTPPSLYDNNQIPDQDLPDEPYIPKAYPPLDPPPRNYAAEVESKIAQGADPVDELPFTFGKYRGILPSKLIHKDPGYLVWVYENVDQNKWYMPDELIHEAKQRAAALPKSR